MVNTTHGIRGGAEQLLLVQSLSGQQQLCWQ